MAKFPLPWPGSQGERPDLSMDFASATSPQPAHPHEKVDCPGHDAGEGESSVSPACPAMLI